jgi:hypothetical protein
MVKRSVEAWRVLFSEQAPSGLTERKFCQERRLCPKYFNLRKKQLGWRGAENVEPLGEPSAFVRIERMSEGNGSVPRAVLRLRGCEWEFWDASAEWIAGLMKALA